MRNKIKSEKQSKSSLKEGVTWNWTQELHTKYVEFMEAINKDNRSSQGPKDSDDECRFDTFEFPEVTPKEKEFWEKKNRRTKDPPRQTMMKI